MTNIITRVDTPRTESTPRHRAERNPMTTTLTYRQDHDHGAYDELVFQAEATDLGADWRQALADESGAEPETYAEPDHLTGNRVRVVFSTTRITAQAGGAITSENPAADAYAAFEDEMPTAEKLREWLFYDAGESGLLDGFEFDNIESIAPTPSRRRRSNTMKHMTGDNS